MNSKTHILKSMVIYGIKFIKKNTEPDVIEKSKQVRFHDKICVSKKYTTTSCGRFLIPRQKRNYRISDYFQLYEYSSNGSNIC